MLVLMVNIKVKPGRRDDFIAAIREDGEGTTTKEEGNLQFSAIQ
ncbi:MAG: antibiotic biosynthesis monooxygenase, partial [Chloroflexi bacterium]|nr:antibiotic biosynthesis monooxygenase [Chloroflexota bacterium]